MGDKVSGALDGIRIVDLSWMVAVPYATLMLALAGAEVIRIESPKRPDRSRSLGDMMGSRQVGPEENPLYNQLNLNKLHLSLNLRHPKAVEIVNRLVEISDAVIENFSPGVMERLGLDYTVLSKINPRIIMLSSSAAGSTGPKADIPGTAAVFGAEGGITYFTGYPNMGPSEIGGSQNDFRSATMSLVALLAALVYRQRTGEGQYIDFSSIESQTCFIGDVISDYLMNRRIPKRLGNHDDVMVPHNCYRCRGQDQWVTIAVASEKEWNALCRIMGNPGWTKSNLFSTSYKRRQNEDKLDKLIEDWTLQHVQEEIVEKLQNAGIAAMPSMNCADILSDRHLQARGYFDEVEHPVIGKQTVIGAFPWFSRTPLQVLRHASLLGQDNDYVLGTLLGLSKAEIQRLVSDEAVYIDW